MFCEWAWRFHPRPALSLSQKAGPIGLVVGRFSTPLLKEHTTVAAAPATWVGRSARAADEARRGGWVGVNKTTESSHQQRDQQTRVPHAADEPTKHGRTPARRPAPAALSSQASMYDTGVAATTLN
jgi:hypothetical protein